MATHWSLSGHPNGAMGPSALTAIITVLVIAPCIGMGLLAFRKSAQRGEISPPMAIAGFIAGLMATVSWMTVRANVDAATWRDAAQLGVDKLVLSLSAGVVLAAVIARLSRPLETAAAAAPDIPRAGLAAGSRAVWVGGARAGWALALALGLLVIAFVVARIHIAAGIGTAVASLAGVWFTSIRVTVDRHGVSIAYGPLRWPVQRIPIAEIRQASVLDVHPMAWGGWGYRGSLKVLKQAAVVLRSGEGVKLELTGDRIFVVTVDDARQAAGLINDLAAPREHGQNQMSGSPPP
jgi:hypothetical protein